MDKINFKNDVCCSLILIPENKALINSKDNFNLIAPSTLILCKGISASNEAVESNGMHKIFLTSEMISSLIEALSKQGVNISETINADSLVAHCELPIVFHKARRIAFLSKVSEYERVRLSAYLLLLLSDFLNYTRVLTFLVQCIKYRMSEQVSFIIRNDITRDWHIESVANMLYMSISTLKNKLREEGTNYTKIVNKCRMDYAIKLLQNGRPSISRVAYKCGYSSASYFSATFKKNFGMTPLQYVRNLEKKLKKNKSA